MLQKLFIRLSLYLMTTALMLMIQLAKLYCTPLFLFFSSNEWWCTHKYPYVQGCLRLFVQTSMDGWRHVHMHASIFSMIQIYKKEFCVSGHRCLEFICLCMFPCESVTASTPAVMALNSLHLSFTTVRVKCCMVPRQVSVLDRNDEGQ